MVVAYFINGFGLALLDAQANGFTAALREQASLKMGHHSFDIWYASFSSLPLL